MVTSVINYRTIALGLMATTFVSCASEQLKPLDDRENYIATEAADASLLASFCTQEAGAIKSRLKFIFLVDKSGSNQSTALDLGTDPYGSRRYNSILSFVKNAPTDSTVSYSLINFETNASFAENKKFQNKENFLVTVKNEKFRNGCTQNDSTTSPGCPVDGGWTDYQKALDKAAGLIDEDTRLAEQNTSEIIASYYVVFMLTDGAPIIGGSPGSYIYIPDSTIFDTVDGLLSYQFGQRKEYVEAVQLHTLYYYNAVTNPDPVIAAEELAFNASNSTRLTSMATKGKGNFISVSDGEVIDFTKFSVPTRKIKHSLKEVYVENLNSIWWNGVLMKDSDGDYLPDDIEKELSSDPLAVDSDKNGIGDGIEYFGSPENRPCRDSKCSASNAEPFSACADLVKTGLPNGQKYGDLDKDGLNDCEERQVLNSNYKDWDSNKDWIPDSLAVKSGIALLGSSDRTADPDADGLTNYYELKFNYPSFFQNSRILTKDGSPYEGMVYNLKLVSDGATKTCYSLSVPNLHPFADTDTFRLHVLENTPIIDDKRFLRTVTKTIENGSVKILGGDLQ